MAAYSITHEEYLRRYAIGLFREPVHPNAERHLREFGLSLINNPARVDAIIAQAREEF